MAKLCEYFLDESLKIDETLTTLDEDLKKLSARLKIIRSSFKKLHAKETAGKAVTTSAPVLYQNTTEGWLDKINFMVKSFLPSSKIKVTQYYIH